MIAARVVAFGFLLNLSSAFGQTHFISLFNAQLRAAFELSHGAVGVLYAAATLGAAAVLPWAGKLIDAADLRKYAAAVVLGLGAAAASMSFAREVWQLAAAFFLLRLFGQGLSSHAAFTAAARLPKKGRGKSISIAGLGMSIGEAVAPPLVAFALLYLEWRGVWRGAALLQCFVVLLAAQWLLAGTPCKPPQKQFTEDGAADGSWTRAQVLRDPRFWRAAPALFAPAMVVTALFFHQYSLAEYKGADFTVWTAAVAAYSAGSVVASLAAGALSDKFGGARVVKWILLPLILALFLPALADFSGLPAAYYGLMGMSAGMSVSSVNALWVEMYGKAHLGAVRALAQSFVALFSAIGPAVYGLLLDFGMPWSGVLYLTAAWLFAAAALLWATPLEYRPPR